MCDAVAIVSRGKLIATGPIVDPTRAWRSVGLRVSFSFRHALSVERTRDGVMVDSVADARVAALL